MGNGNQPTTVGAVVVLKDGRPGPNIVACCLDGSEVNMNACDVAPTRASSSAASMAPIDTF